ncbi:MAG: glycosyltransferase family 2 protein [Bacteroides sp.]|nr:glycosyltransferase family 2 protein [Bacteroides sp.]
MKSKVSVIIPVLNRKDLLLRCLDSIGKQTHRPLELIIVDNGSTDGTPEAAVEWGEVHASKDFEVRILREAKPGACAARNKGLNEATGELALFFDSDDTMRHDLISLAVREFEKQPDTDIVCWKCELHQLDGSIRRPPFTPEKALECHLIHALLRTQGYMARTVAFRSAGGWDESLSCWNDWELGVRMLLGNPKIIGIGEALVYIYAQSVSITGESFSKKAGSWEKSLAAIRRDINESHRPDKEKLLAIVSYRDVILAAHYAKEGNSELIGDLLDSTSVRKSKTLKMKLRGLILSAVFHYTRYGGRGVWKMVGNLIKSF